MNPHDSVLQGVRLALATLIAMIFLVGCSGDDGAPGAPGEPGEPGTGVVPKSTTSELSISITGVTINSPPVVNFTVTNEDGVPVGGLNTDDLRFTLAKLVPRINGSPSYWQSYIVTTKTGVTGSPGEGDVMVQATRENSGTLVDNLNGSYSYTFQIDITNVSCPAPCTDADGNPLDLSYQPNLTHRLGIQTRGSLPAVNAIYTFRPDGNPITTSREIVKTATCNECHNELEAHDARIETGYCVTCHNPGSTDPSSGNTVDFKVMIHKIHRSEGLPSVVNGGTYSIYGYNPATYMSDLEYDFSDIAFPQDIRNCTKCHDGSDPDTPQGDAWQTPSIAGCGSCHDDVDFSTGANHGPPGNEGGAQTDFTCIGCHKIDGTGLAPSAAQAHTIPASAPKVASGKFKYNILAICGTSVDADPACAPNSTPTVTFSVSDPTGGIHDYGGTNTNYNIFADPEFTTAGASLNILTAWDTRDYTNDGGTGTRPSRANSISALALTIGTDIVDDGTGVFTVDTSRMDPIPVTALGSGAIAMEGRPRGESVVGSGTFDIRVPVKGQVAYFGITDTIPVARRIAVDIEYKCDNCHDLLSEHGNNRAENAQLCVLCHNPRGTDVGDRTKDANGLPIIDPRDGKKEESIDFRRLIHGIHAAQKDDPNTPEIEGYGFREKGLVVGSHEYGHVRFPGILSDCTTCHNSGTYELKGIWETPTQNDILASTVQAVPDPYDPVTSTYDLQVADQTNDLTISPTAAVCSACHDSGDAQWHMEHSGTAQFNVLQQDVYPYEDCATCHGPGRLADVKVVHGVK